MSYSWIKSDGALQKAAIIGKPASPGATGGVWGATEGFTVSPEEEKKIDKAFREQSLAEGVVLGGTKYMGRAFLQDNLLHGVRTSEPRSEATLVWALTNCYVVTVFDVPTQAQSVIPCVNALASHLGG
ncbi:Profilin domain-containing protein [Rhizoctonia solani AG-1 IA]|uniref:Profilin domain-containing protein n=1 Tax=Thanatephorus cucumeris (strain AG1-IA) TaxID=983506 RepID=L8WLR5_THACA|nr:Profilin domain-containing protein [Rhizoctonia solani AG-1 IA]